MGKIQDVVGKMRKGSYLKSIREDLRQLEKSMIFSEESSRIIHELGNIELCESGQMSSTVQCHSCFKHLPEGSDFSSCGVCLRHDEATIGRVKARFQTLIVPYFFARVDRSRSKKHDETQWQQDHWKAVDAKRGAKTHDKATNTIRWQQDEKYRNSQLAHGWTEEYCGPEHLATIEISYIATW